jgi:alpha-N-arabinofuranosidase
MPALELRIEAPPLRRAAPPPQAFRDEFDTGALSAGWMFVRNPVRGSWSLRERPGFLRLRGLPGTLSDTAPLALVCRRQQHLDVTMRAQLEFEPRRPGEEGGLCVRANEGFHAELLVGLGERGRELRLLQALNGRVRTLGQAPLPPGPVTLAVRATARAYAFSGGAGGALHALATVPTSDLSAETILDRSGSHHFTGATVGLFATGGVSRSTAAADFSWFEYLPGP